MALEFWQGIVLLTLGIGIGWVIWGIKGDRQ